MAKPIIFMRRWIGDRIYDKIISSMLGWICREYLNGTRVTQSEVYNGIGLWFWDAEKMKAEYQKVNKNLKKGLKLLASKSHNKAFQRTVSEAFPNRSLIWKVAEANHDLESITKKNEWKGTTIKWEIFENKTGSKITLTHEGLVPALECFEICEAGWGYFLGSLKNYLETGRGYPYKG